MTRSAGIQRAVKLVDSVTAATAITAGLPVATQDDGFDAMAEVHPSLHVLKL